MIPELNDGLEKLNINLTDQQLNKLEQYISRVLEFNKSYNLMKAETPAEMAVNHVLDSLAPFHHIKNLLDELKSVSKNQENKELMLGDIGSGGGCPGIPLSIAFPEFNFTLVERMEKRCVFLESCVKGMNLKNVTVFCTQADKVEKSTFDLIVFRAFHPFDKKIIGWLKGMVKKGGYICAYKARSEKIQAEMQEISGIVKDYKKIPLTIPGLEDHERNLVVIKN